MNLNQDKRIAKFSTINFMHFWLSPKQPVIFRILIIFGTLLLSVVLSTITPQRFLLVIPFFIIGISFILMLMKWPPLGLVALIGTIIIPINGPSNSNATLALAGLLLTLWFMSMVLHKRQIKMMESPTIKPLISLVIVVILSFGIGQLPWFRFAQHAPIGAQMAGLSIFLLSVGVFLLAAHQIQDIRWLKLILWSFLAIGGAFILGRLFPIIGNITSPFFTSQATGSMFWTWLVAMAFSQAIFNKDLHPLIRLLFFALVLGTFYIGVIRLQDWKSGWVPALASIGVIAALRSWRLALISILPGIAFLPNLWSRMLNSDQYSYSTRLDAWKIILEIIKVNPLFGLGPANYHWYTPLFSIRGYYVQFNSHNQYFDIVAQTGILGLISYMWFFWEVIRISWQMRTRELTGFGKAYLFGVMGGIAGTLVAGILGDWVLPFFYNITLGGFRASVLPWLFMGCLIALDQITQEKIQKK